MANKKVTNSKLDKQALSDLEGHLGGFPVTGISSLESCVAEARTVWGKAMRKMYETEEELDTVLRLNEKPKLYALDAIAVFKELNISKRQRDTVAQLFSLFYLAVHLFDDAVEDTEKLRGKFDYNGSKVEPDQVTALIASFSLNLDLCIARILKNESPRRVATFLHSVNYCLSKQFRYFMVEKNRSLKSLETLGVKQHYVSGESTAFMVECLKAVGVKLGKKESDLRKSLFYLGSLTQFTDDFRDLDEDRENGNLNLIISIEKEFGKDKALHEFSNLYKKEENLMVKYLKKAGIKDIEMFKSIPWHPIFMKHLV